MATFDYFGIWHAVEWMTHFTGLRIHGSGGWGGPAGGFLPRYSLPVAFRMTSFGYQCDKEERRGRQTDQECGCCIVGGEK